MSKKWLYWSYIGLLAFQSSLYTAAHVLCVLFSISSSCLDINECVSDSLNECDGNADCIDTIGSYNCSCNTGYEGDGFSCTGYTYIMHVKLQCIYG